MYDRSDLAVSTCDERFTIFGVSIPRVRDPAFYL